MALALEKKQELVRLQLEKRQVPTGIIMAVKMMLDVSGSTSGLYRDGTVQELVDRLIPVAMRFDDNQSLEAYAFGTHVQQVADVNPADFANYIGKFLNQVKGHVLWSGTKYGTALAQLASDITPSNKATGFLKGLFGKKQEVQPPSFTMFITDGDTQGDEQEAEVQLAKIGLLNGFVMLVGVGGLDFDFLRRMDAKFKHVGFVTFPDLNKVTDEDMYAQLLNEKLCAWIKTR